MLRYCSKNFLNWPKVNLRSRNGSFTSLAEQDSSVLNPRCNRPTTDDSEEFKRAKPFASIPRPSKYYLLKEFLPGIGKFHNSSLIDFYRLCREEHGDIFLLPGMFGKRDIVFTFNPDDFQKIFRTEGIWPVRQGLDIVQYYRKVLRKDLFKHAGGLVAEQGESWSQFRSMVNPVMMAPNIMKLYIPKMDKLADDFVQKIKEIRDPNTNEVPNNFDLDMKRWALEAAAIVVLDNHLGAINENDKNSDLEKFIEAIGVFFNLIYKLDLQPSLWKVIRTPTYYKLIAAFDLMTELSIKYIDQALERLRKNPDIHTKDENEKSVLEKLLNIDRLVAIVMAMDTLLAGVDTTSSALAGCLLGLAKFPHAQNTLRQEIQTILPDIDSKLTAHKMKNVPYLRAVIKEGQRLFPVSTGNFRSVGQDIVLSGYQIPVNTNIAMPAQLLMRDTRYYEKPNDFLPERWLRSHKDLFIKNDNPFLYLPFGFGPRMCIGKRVTEVELEIILAKIIRKFHVEFNYSTDNAFKANLINVPNIPLKFKFTNT